jgi:hypothetical protein
LLKNMIITIYRGIRGGQARLSLFEDAKHRVKAFSGHRREESADVGAENNSEDHLQIGGEI